MEPNSNSVPPAANYLPPSTRRALHEGEDADSSGSFRRTRRSKSANTDPAHKRAAEMARMQYFNNLQNRKSGLRPSTDGIAIMSPMLPRLSNPMDPLLLATTPGGTPKEPLPTSAHHLPPIEARSCSPLPPAPGPSQQPTGGKYLLTRVSVDIHPSPIPSQPNLHSRPRPSREFGAPPIHNRTRISYAGSSTGEHLHHGPSHQRLASHTGTTPTPRPSQLLRQSIRMMDCAVAALADSAPSDRALNEALDRLHGWSTTATARKDGSPGGQATPSLPLRSAGPSGNFPRTPLAPVTEPDHSSAPGERGTLGVGGRAAGLPPRAANLRRSLELLHPMPRSAPVGLREDRAANPSSETPDGINVQIDERALEGNDRTEQESLPSILPPEDSKSSRAPSFMQKFFKRKA